MHLNIKIVLPCKWFMLTLFISGPYFTIAQNPWVLGSPVSSIHQRDPGRKSFFLDTMSLFTQLKEGRPIPIPINEYEYIHINFKPCSNFSPDLASRYNGITTICGQSAGSNVNIDIVNLKIHVFIIHLGKAYFIEPDPIISMLYHLSSDATSSPIHERFGCNTETRLTGLPSIYEDPFRSSPLQKTGMRTYRLALAVTGEFARTHGSTIEAVMTALNSHLSRINTVYRIEHAIQFKLVPNNDTLIFMNPESDPYSNGNVNAMLEQNPKVLNDRIGLNNYDIGHVFGTNAGGVAQLGSTCGAFKGAGVSSTFGMYTGLQFYLIPCHEIGHQFNATHTFNFCDNDNETSGSAFEPGSGSTIMSYAGASNCGANYVQGLSDPYFHTFSIQQVRQYSRSGIGSLCGIEVITSNDQPLSVVNVPNNLTIPILTPFELEGTAMDDTKNTLTYAWEEMDLGQKSPLGSPSGTAPLFRSIPPDTLPIRIFPKLASILANQSTITEVLPVSTRPINFRFTVRDNDASGGGVHWADLALQTSGQAGPFKITSLNSADTIFRSGLRYLTWLVANTDLPPVDCKTVDIYLSEDGGKNFNILLKSQTPNDGGEWIQFPDKSINQLRIKIKGHDHVFFDINDGSLVELANFSNRIQLGVFPDRQTICAGSALTYKILAAPSNGTDSLMIKVINPFSTYFDITLSKPFLRFGDSLSLNVKVDPEVPPGLYTIALQAINSGVSDTVNLSILIKVISGNIPLLSPGNNEGQVALLPVFKWKSNSFQEGFRIELARDPGFIQVVWSKLILVDSIAIPDAELEGNSIYFWRLVPENGCGLTKIPFVVFHTLALDCKTYISGDTPKFISATGAPTITSIIPIMDQLSIKQIRIPSLAGSHEFVGDLELYLRAPSGDSILLWSRQCNNLSNFNLSLDDMAPIPITCPLTDRKVHQPLQPFSGLNLSNSNGNWTLRVRDAMNGSGGSLDGWSLQLCGALEGQGPVVNVNRKLEILELKSIHFGPADLLVLDPDTQADDLKIQLLTVPAFGYLLKNGTDTLKSGSVFTQSEVNEGLIIFQAFSVDQDTLDFFRFLAFDEKNNWTGQQEFLISILNDFSSPVEEEAGVSPLRWYPNPASQFIHFENSSPEPLVIHCYSIDGKHVFTARLGSREHQRFHLPGNMEGIYILQFRIKKLVLTNKLMILKN